MLFCEGFQYNYLNLPKQITQSSKVTSYTYRADGAKVKKLFGDLETDYLDGFQYKSTKPSEANSGGGFVIVDPNEVAVMKLRIIPTSEGYYDALIGQYIYNFTDHLGNVRLSYTDTNKDGIIQPRQYRVQQCDVPTNPFSLPNCIDIWKPGEIVEVNNYYPFGMLHNYTATTQNAYQYKYNGKELQETGMYDYGARMYMPDIGRWGSIDPLVEKMTRHSPYNYAFNNPIMFIDPDGREGEDWFENIFGNLEFKDDIQSQQDLDDKGIEGTYVGDTYQDGNINYAADGYVYDDSAAGGGKAIANGRDNPIEEVVMTKSPSIGRQVWNFTADNIISKPAEGIQFFSYFFYGLGQVPGEMYKQGRMENIHVKMDMTLWGFKNGLPTRTLQYTDGETVMSEQEKFEKIAVPGIEALSFGVGTKLNLVKQPAINFGTKMGIKTAVKKSIYNSAQH